MRDTCCGSNKPKDERPGQADHRRDQVVVRYTVNATGQRVGAFVRLAECKCPAKIVDASLKQIAAVYGYTQADLRFLDMSYPDGSDASGLLFAEPWQAVSPQETPTAISRPVGDKRDVVDAPESAEAAVERYVREFEAIAARLDW